MSIFKFVVLVFGVGAAAALVNFFDTSYSRWVELLEVIEKHER